MGIAALIPILGPILERVFPDPAKRMELTMELEKLASQERIAQAEVNKVEASHSSLFVAGWRPAVGWSCVGGMLYTVIVAPAFGLPVAETAFLRDVLLGMLGISVAARSVEKLKGVAQNSLDPDAPPKPKKKILGIAPWPF